MHFIRDSILEQIFKGTCISFRGIQCTDRGQIVRDFLLYYGYKNTYVNDFISLSTQETGSVSWNARTA